MNRPFFTIGHSDRSLPVFERLLHEAGVELVVDIRRLPGSRAHPQFDADALGDALAADGIGYDYAAALGGRRGRDLDVADEVNALWHNRSFHNYADYALSDAFGLALDALVVAGRRRTSTVMCAEAVWWRCHRRIVADHLLARGERVFHILSAGRIEPARMTEGACPQADGRVVYPAPG
ncbi:MAG TPA: DUF488 domain-containing protein [Luteimonas sp.]|nr:DUF488 domain-containing protein [Luteimonas sp.]HRO26824.1 DUF488 domain-containing protein [Luteimonas sp.]HRP71662.1 DUF488 domain-containing protein [Luteimonas sp.]